MWELPYQYGVSQERERDREQMWKKAERRKESVREQNKEDRESKTARRVSALSAMYRYYSL